MMERILLGVLLLSGWSISSDLVRQYHYVAESMSWAEAQTYCREKYTDLATMENQEEVNQLTNTISSSGNKSDVWIGLYGNMEWSWSDGYTGVGAEYRERFASPYPQNRNDFNCIVTSRSSSWLDTTCKSKFPFVCNNGTQQNPEFIFVAQPMSWFGARNHCRENYRDLATVRNDTDHKEVQHVLQVTYSYVWIGLFRETSWSDGSSSIFRHWDGSSVPPTGVMCGVAKSSGIWKFSLCETRLPFVCYGTPPPPPEPVMRQTVKLRIQPGGSVDLNDPAVQADMLRKLQDQLKEKGLTGVTLKWRVQPDGKVFHKEGKGPQKKKMKKNEL